MKDLNFIQKKITNKICEFFDADVEKAKLYLPVGFGKSVIIVSAIRQIMKNNNNEPRIAVLSRTRMICGQIESVFMEEECNFGVALHIRDLTEQKILITQLSHQ